MSYLDIDSVSINSWKIPNNYNFTKFQRLIFFRQEDQAIIRRRPRSYYGRRMERARKVAMKKLQELTGSVNQDEDSDESEEEDEE